MLASGHPFLEGVTLNAWNATFLRLNVSPDGEPFLPFAHGNFGRLRPVRIPRETIHYDLQWSRGAAMRGLRAKVSAGTGLAQESHSMNSTFGKSRDLDRDTSLATMHPADAEPRAIQTATSGFAMAVVK